jgi:NTE family protein
MLAALADLGLLSSVEVISSVSGGSHVAALYYLKIKRLLESKKDRNGQPPSARDVLSDENYRELVGEIECQFLEVVQWNIRTRVISNVLRTFKMYSAKYSRSDRMAELLDNHLFGEPFKMESLRIQPLDSPEPFKPSAHNGNRHDKVPILLLNATNLVTGHNWRFEAVRMGEPPRDWPVQQIVDKNLRLPRPQSWDDMPSSQRDLTLGFAVAASACVPALFHPLAISDMYRLHRRDETEEDVRPQLIDGGVHDNQGVQALFDRHCTHLIVSDASGAMEDNPDPSTHFLSVLMRTNGILMDRVREQEMFRVFSSGGSRHQLRVLTETPPRVALMHLQRGLPPERAALLGGASGSKGARGPKTKFGIPAKVQENLSRIRTDLDSFSDVEAYSLMYDGYVMTKSELKSQGKDFDQFRVEPEANHPWKFLDIRSIFENPGERFLRHLEVGRHRAFKVFRLYRGLTIVLAIIALVPLAFLTYTHRSSQWPSQALRWCFRQTEEFLPSSQGELAIVILSLIGVAILASLYAGLAKKYGFVRKLRSPIQAASRIVTRVAVPALIGWVIAWIHLTTTDRLFKRAGRLKNL